MPQDVKRVLFVDDDPIAVRIYGEGLSRQGFEVATAGDGVAALRSLRERKPDVVILDLMMPRLSGVEVLKFVRAEREFQNLPVIVLSNAYMDALARSAAELGAQKGLLKLKCNPVSLASAIREVLEGGPSTEGVDHLLAASKGPTQPSPKPAAPPASKPDPVEPSPAPKLAAPHHPGVDSREQARQELTRNAGAISRSLGELFDSFKNARNDRERELQLQSLYRKVHFIAAMGGMAEHQAIAQLASCFEALLFNVMDKLPRLQPSLERTTTAAVRFLQELLARPADFGAGPPQHFWTLVVDDDALSNRLVVSALRNAQLQARGTEDPQTALRMLQEKHYDLVLLDVEMPGMNGLELCKRLRALAGYENTPVIYVTLHSDFETLAKSILSGGTDLIAKPVSPIELATKVLMHLFKSQTPARPAN